VFAMKKQIKGQTLWFFGLPASGKSTLARKVVHESAGCVLLDGRLWKKAASGNMPHLTGAGGEWEEPTDCALTIQTDAMSVDQAFAAIKQRFGWIENGR